MPVQTTHRFTVKEYYRMAEIGVLRPDARVELLDGEIIDMSPIGPFHNSVVNQLNEIFMAAAKGRWTTAIQNSIRLNEHSEPQPDLALFKKASDLYRKRLAQPKDIFLLIEVADSSLATDQEIKLPAYGQAGIAEVWIVNLVEQTVEVCREPNFDGYSAKSVLRPGDQ